MTVQAVPSSSISSRSSLAWRFWNKGKANGAATSTSLKPSSSSTISKKTKKDKKHKKKKKKSSRDDESNKQHRFDSVSTTIPSEVRTSSLNHSRDGSVSSTNSMTEMMPSHSYDASESFRLASASNIESIDVPRQIAEGITLDQQEALKDEAAQQVERIDLDVSMQALMEAEEHQSTSFESSRVDLDASVQVILDLQKLKQSEDHHDKTAIEVEEADEKHVGEAEESVVEVDAKEPETVVEEEDDVEDEDTMKEVLEKTVLIENALPDVEPTTPVNQNGAATIINPQDETQRVLRYFFAAVTTSLFLGLFVGRGKGKETTK